MEYMSVGILINRINVVDMLAEPYIDQEKNIYRKGGWQEYRMPYYLSQYNVQILVSYSIKDWR